MNPAKVRFVSTELSFLGHLVSSNGVTNNPSHTRKVLSFPPPKNVKGIARFIGMVNYFHKFIPNLAEVTVPLNRLRKKMNYFSLGTRPTEAFEKLKQVIASPLAYIENRREWVSSCSGPVAKFSRRAATYHLRLLYTIGH